MLSYEGLFFGEEMVKLIHSLETNQLENVNDELHCTFKYHPSENEIFNDIVGKNFEVYLIGYANDGNNSGFEIELPAELRKYYINYEEQNPSELKVPHITASLANGAKAVKTKDLDFKPLEEPIKLVGRFGYWIKDEGKEYISYEPYIRTRTEMNDGWDR